MASLSCSFASHSTNCDISKRSPGVNEFFPVTSCKTDTRSHLRTIKVGQTTLPTERDLILARTGHFREDGAYMTICPADRAEIGTFWQPRRKCGHPLNGNWKAELDRRSKETESSSQVAVDHPVCKIPQAWTLKISRRVLHFTESRSEENLPRRGRDRENSQCYRCV